jgi:prevent-host-death family protein
LTSPNNQARIAIMRTATITEAKNGLSALLDHVKAGETVLLTDRGVPIAVIEPVSTVRDAPGRLARLARSGAVRPGTRGALPRSFLETPPPALRRDVDAVGMLIDDRAERA